jgi:hypothetical protein
VRANLSRIKATNCLNRTKIQLTHTLRKADENPSFSRFSDLPPELRNEIYKYAIADLSPKREPRMRPASPEICRVNKQTRRESLPLFFNSIDQNIIVSWSSVGPDSHHPQKAVLCKEYHTYFENARKLGWLQHMRRFHFRIMKREQTPGGNGQAKIDPNARYYVKFSNMMENVKTWRRAEKDKKGRLPNIEDTFLPKIVAGMATTIGGRNNIMTAKKLNFTIAVFLDTVDLHFAE